MNRKNSIALFFAITLLFASCSFQKRQVITLEGYRETHIGMSEEALKKQFGEPLNIYVHDNGVVVYEYIERFHVANPDQNAVVEARRYYFHIKDGKVASKQMQIRNVPGYEPMNEV